MPFSPDYVRLVLNENFEDAKALFLAELVAIDYGHLVMLADVGIVKAADARALRDALDGIDLDRVREAVYDGSCEDLFFYVERLVSEACGAEIAGQLHTARSRNDIDMTLYRMKLRGFLLNLAEATLELRNTLVALAANHVHTVFPAHTHTQPAQPSTVAHYLLSMIEQLERDTGRLLAAYRSTNRNPLGACAITGTGFPIDRQRTSDLLGFDGPTGNTYGSIATVDYLLEAAGAAAVTLVGLGRFVQDMLLWCTNEMHYLRLAEGFVQVSSIMPQKRNPVALEHARALSSKALAQLHGIPLAVHNTPHGDIVDTEDDLQPLVTSAFRDAARAVGLVAAAMAEAEFDIELMRTRAGRNWVTITELADTLAREHDLPFTAGHAIATRIVRGRTENPDASVSDLLAAASREVADREIRLSEPDLERILSPDHFVAVRKTLGGPSPDVVAAALDRSRGLARDDEAELTRRRDALAAADAQRRAAARAL
jgi:argininosuccinate lyase